VGEIDPYGQIQEFTPRSTNIVDAIAETKRVTESALRSNPLRNAVVDDGLMKWRGNYAGGLGGAYLWIGEFSPNDGVLGKRQRGFALSRDDPKHARVLWVYDDQGEAANPINKPLRQQLTMHDADDAPILREARSGGVQWPWAAVPIYPIVEDFYEVGVFGGGTEFLPIIPAANCINGANRGLFRGYGPMVGHMLKFFGFVVSTLNNPVVGVHLELVWNNPAGTTYTSSEISCAGGTTTNLFWDLDFAGQGLIGYEVQVNVVGRLISGTYKWSFVYPTLCYSHGL
jgi:hypothetical protein